MNHNEIQIKTQQIEIKFEGINQTKIAQILKDIEKCGKTKVKNITGKLHFSLCYDNLDIDTFNCLCERFKEVPTYHSYSERWHSIVIIRKNDELFNDIFINLYSERLPLEFNYSKNKPELS